jgi:hypothetical protein
MAGGAVVNTGGGKDYPGKLTMFVLFACIVAATGGLIFGYDIGISGTSPFNLLPSMATALFCNLHHDYREVTLDVLNFVRIHRFMESLFASAMLCCSTPSATVHLPACIILGTVYTHRNKSVIFHFISLSHSPGSCEATMQKL